MTRDQMLAHLRAADEVAREAAAHGHHPFGAVLVGPDDSILMRQGNIDTVRHAETELSRRAATAYPAKFLWSCTLVSTGEPCAMCTGTLYWANIGRLVYGFEEEKLLAETSDHPENPTMNLASRTVLASGQKPIEVFGPSPRSRTNYSAPTGPSGAADAARPMELDCKSIPRPGVTKRFRWGVAICPFSPPAARRWPAGRTSGPEDGRHLPHPSFSRDSPRCQCSSVSPRFSQASCGSGMVRSIS